MEISLNFILVNDLPDRFNKILCFLFTSNKMINAISRVWNLGRGLPSLKGSIN